MKRILFMSICALGLLVAVSIPIGLAPRATAANLATVRLISAGKSPRSKLRVAVAEGAQVQGTMVMSESIVQSVGGKQINSVNTPPITVGIHVLAGTPSKAGQTPISYGYSNVSVVDDGSLSQAQLSQFQAAVAPLGSLTATGTLTSRNQVLDSKVSGTSALDPTVARLVSQLSNQLGAISTPFPREAVGIGARWQGTSLVHVSGITLRQVTEYTLRQRTGSQFVVAITTTQTAPRQRADIPGVPKGTKVEVVKSNVSGSGSATQDLTRPMLPIASETRVSGTQVLAVNGQGQHATLVQKITIGIKISQ
jgi:hypothetical protein